MSDDNQPVEPAEALPTDVDGDVVDPDEDTEPDLDEGELHDPAGNFLDHGQDKDDTGDQPNGGM